MDAFRSGDGTTHGMQQPAGAEDRSRFCGPGDGRRDSQWIRLVYLGELLCRHELAVDDPRRETARRLIG